jgi:CHAT domain-containing protein
MCVVRQLSVIVTVLCILVSGCPERKDTNVAKSGPRIVVPMIDGAEWQPCRDLPPEAGSVMEKSECATPPAEFHCDEIDNAEAAVRLISVCTDEAIAKLEESSDTLSRTHLAAAYYVRAQNEDRPSDLLLALDAATAAAAMQPPLAAAVFNRALIQEALGLRELATASWEEFGTLDASKWADEARDHRNALVAARQQDATVQWPLTEMRIAEAVRRRDRASLADLMKPFPSATADYLTVTVLAQWAEHPTAERLEDARFLAAELARSTGDRFPLEVVEAIPASPDVAALRQGLRDYRTGRDAQEALQSKSAADSFKAAVQALTRGGSPLRLEAALRAAYYTADGAAIDDLEHQALQRSYKRLMATVHVLRVRQYGKDFLKSIPASEAAVAAYKSARDPEELAKAYSKGGDAWSLAGQHELAWREMIQAMQLLPHVRKPRDRSLILGTASKIALALGHADIALLYADAAIVMLRRALQSLPGGELEHIRGLQTNLAHARRWRADALRHLGRDGEALDELTEAARLLMSQTDAETRRLLDSANDASRGDTLLQTDPLAAIQHYTRALEHTGTRELHAYTAWLYAQRAEAHRLAKQDPEPDLLSSLQTVEAEGMALLARRQRGEGEELWNGYFSRFQKPYHRLLRLYIDQERYDDALQIAEGGRAYELLQFVGGARARPGTLPDGTFVLEYVVMDDRTYVFIVSNGALEVVTLPVTASDVEKWRAAFMRAVTLRKEQEAAVALEKPYARLVAEPLRRIQQKFARVPNLVFVPDGAMHGMPLAALRDGATKKHLIEKAIVSIAPSMALYLHARAVDAAMPFERIPSLLLVGDPAFRRNEFTQGLDYPLHHARAEVHEIRALNEAGVEILLGGDATVPAFLSAAKNKTIVHLAAHSIVNADAPSKSTLVLAPSADDEGLLTAEELVRQLKLNRTRLMVLSTCSSAGGRPIGPEGVAPLVRPLFGAGVPAIIGTLWNVEDATAKEFLVSFHRDYRTSSDAASAMRSAQLKLLGNNNILTWAPFQVIGYASSPYGGPPQRGTHNGLHPSSSVQRSDGLRPQ